MHGQPDLLGDLAHHADLERLAGLDETGQQREQPLGPHGLPGQHRTVVAVVYQADHRGVDAGKLLVPVERVDARPAALDRLGRRTVDRAEPRVVMPIQQRGGRRDQLCADVVEDLPGAAQVEHLGFGVRVVGFLQRGANRPHVPAVGHAAKEHGVLRWLVAQLGGLTEYHLAAGDQDLVAPVDPQQQGVGPSGDGGVDVGAQRVGAVGTDSGQQRDVTELEPAPSSLGFRAADVQQPVTELQCVDLGVVDAQQRRRRERLPARCRSGAGANRRLPSG